MTAIDVLFIAGTGRSGSTVIEHVIAARCGYVAVGELRSVWDRGLRQDQLCGCGSPFRSCPFWTSVFDVAFGGISNVDADAFDELASRVCRTRHIPGLVNRRLRLPALRADTERYLGILGTLYAAIEQVTGATTVIDSSKDARHGFAAAAVPNVRVRVLHLVRDSRAVAYSWTKRRRRPEIHWEEAFMPQFSPARSSHIWLQENLTANALRRTVAPSQLVRYEQLTTDSAHLDRLLQAESAGRERSGGPTGAPLLHSVSGNPVRFEPNAAFTLHVDDEWRRQLPARDFRTVTTLTAPLLIAYGYDLRRRQ
jgi:hypothetical protein